MRVSKKNTLARGKFILAIQAQGVSGKGEWLGSKRENIDLWLKTIRRHMSNEIPCSEDNITWKMFGY